MDEEFDLKDVPGDNVINSIFENFNNTPLPRSQNGTRRSQAAAYQGGDIDRPESYICKGSFGQ